MVRTPRPSCPVWVLGFLVLLALSPAAAQQITYEYDPLGRLLLVSSPEGVARYEYDAVGNILRIVTRRSSDVSGPVAILLMNPAQGPVGTRGPVVSGLDRAVVSRHPDWTSGIRLHPGRSPGPAPFNRGGPRDDQTEASHPARANLAHGRLGGR